MSSAGPRIPLAPARSTTGTSEARLRRVAIADLLASQARVAELAETLSRGGVAAVPTESFYALAADPMSRSGCTRVFGLKGRSEASALLVLFARRSQLPALGVAAPPRVLDRFLRIWPAPLTVVFPLSAPIPASAQEATLGVRVPAHEALRRLLERIGPVTGTSLNRSGEPPSTDPDEVERVFGGNLDVLVDGGRTPGGLASTLLDATVEPPRVLRAGAFPWPPAG